ncbi:MAG: GMC family oxidoreductase [Chrysiogenetes bacterium]|nr:GMC family oxidoreductase [Chrysiogenetes bacterium]
MSIFTGADIKNDLEIECDVCVVGSGAGGAHVAARLAEAGKRVVVLEEGSHNTSEKFNMNEADMYPLLYQDGGNRATADLSIAILQGRTVGGTTVVNWTTSFRTPEHVVEWWNEHHGVNINYDDLVPHWERVEARLGIERVELGFANRNNRVLWDGAQKLGWEASMLRRNVRECANTGYCGTGCPVDAKQSMLITLVPEAVSYGADVYANVKVETIKSGASRKITEIRGIVRDPETDKPTSKRVTVRPKLAVLSGGGINNPMIFFRSGIGNSNGRVGKRTFLHPACGTVAYFDEKVDPYYGAPQSVSSHQFARREGKMGFFLEAAPLQPMLGSTAIPGFGNPHTGYMERLPYANALVMIGIDGFDTSDFDEGGVVSMKKDGGIQVDYKWTPRLEESFREGIRACANLQLAAGATEVLSMHNDPVVMRSEADLAKLDKASYAKLRHKVFCAHVMGGCAMGGDPKTSVVDSSLRHHEFDNLFVVDGSVYPTSLGVNPQLSIYGLSSWASETIKSAV